MNYDIILVFCPIFGVKEPPLGISYIAENLSASGWQVCVKDLNLEFYLSNRDKQNLWETSTLYDVTLPQIFKKDISRVAQEIAKSNIPLVGFSVNQHNLSVSVALARRIKELNKTIIIIFGGPECFLKPDRDHIPLDALDYFIVGDGEIIADKFLSNFFHKDILKEIDGVVAARDNRELIFNPKIYPSLKDLALPTFKDFEVEKYTSRSLPVIFTKGCLRNCVFCNDQSYYRPFSVVNPLNLADTLQFYNERYGISSFSFHDQAINGDQRILRQFLEEVIRRKMKIEWSSNIIVRENMDLNFFEMMKAAGCQSLIFGIESFSDRVLNRMKKGFTAEEAIHALRLCKEAGINVLINLILGFPGETEDDISQTIRSLVQNREIINKVLNLSSCIVAPNSELERRPEDFSIVLPNNHFCNWYTTDGKNTNDFRNLLVERMKIVLKDLGIPLETVNIFKDDFTYSKLDEKLMENKYSDK